MWKIKIWEGEDGGYTCTQCGKMKQKRAWKNDEGLEWLCPKCFEKRFGLNADLYTYLRKNLI